MVLRSAGWVWPVARALASHPSLWPTALVQFLRLTPPGWWRRWPPVPGPDPDYLAFRARTAYGDPAHPPEPADVVAWLAWCRDQGRAGEGRRRS